LPELRLELLLLGDVVGHHESASAASELKIVRRHVDGDRPAVFDPVYPRPETAKTGLGQRHGLLDKRHFLRRNNVGEAHGQELVAGVTIVLDGSFVCFEETKSLDIEHPRRMRVAVEEPVKPLFAFPKRLFGPRPSPALCRLADGALDGGNEAFDGPVLVLASCRARSPSYPGKP
jgi:hypothetical protein